MSQSKYVLVASDGTSHDLSKEELFNQLTYDLGELLEDGWRPVHETPLGRAPFIKDDGEEGTELVYALVLLVKD
jgi:hypothetical protein